MKMSREKKSNFWEQRKIKEFFERNNETLSRIKIDPEIMDGLPVISGTRIPIYVILELIEAGYSWGKILAQYPSLIEKDIKAALRFASLATALH